MKIFRVKRLQGDELLPNNKNTSTKHHIGTLSCVYTGLPFYMYII